MFSNNDEFLLFWLTAESPNWFYGLSTDLTDSPVQPPANTAKSKQDINNDTAELLFSSIIILDYSEDRLYGMLPIFQS